MISKNFSLIWKYVLCNVSYYSKKNHACEILDMSQEPNQPILAFLIMNYLLFYSKKVTLAKFYWMRHKKAFFKLKFLREVTCQKYVMMRYLDVICGINSKLKRSANVVFKKYGSVY
jgi:hypothetical protein